MPLLSITSIDDPRVAAYRLLKGRDPAIELGLFVVESELLVRRLMQSTYETASILATERMATKLLPDVPAGVPIYACPEPVLHGILGFPFHRGVMACGVRPASERVSIDALASARRIVAFPFPSAQENLGLILRSIAGLGADGVLIGSGGADVFSRQTVRVSAGTLFKLPLAISLDVAGDLRRLREERGMKLIAATLSPRAVPLHTLTPPANWALIVGNEYEGIPPALENMCDHEVTIPMSRDVDSLNVAIATSIVLYELMRGRR